MVLQTFEKDLLQHRKIHLICLSHRRLVGRGCGQDSLPSCSMVGSVPVRLQINLIEHESINDLPTQLCCLTKVGGCRPIEIKTTEISIQLLVVVRSSRKESLLNQKCIA